MASRGATAGCALWQGWGAVSKRHRNLTPCTGSQEDMASAGETRRAGATAQPSVCFASLHGCFSRLLTWALTCVNKRSVPPDRVPTQTRTVPSPWEPAFCSHSYRAAPPFPVWKSWGPSPKTTRWGPETLPGDGERRKAYDGLLSRWPGYATLRESSQENENRGIKRESALITDGKTPVTDDHLTRDGKTQLGELKKICQGSGALSTQHNKWFKNRSPPPAASCQPSPTACDPPVPRTPCA